MYGVRVCILTIIVHNNIFYIKDIADRDHR